MGKRAYLDFAAAAPVSPGALKAYAKAVKAYGNPSAAHAEGRAARAILENARRRIAALAGVKPDGVIFTAGATEANALAIRGHVKARMKAGARAGDLHLICLPSAHASTAETVRSLAGEGILIDELPLLERDVDLGKLAKMLRPETALVSMEAVSAETGARFDTRGVRRALDEARSGSVSPILHVDATQLPLVESFERTRLAADLISLDAQKVGGVRGIGCLITSPRVPLSPVMEGGGQERGLRSGTETPAHAIAFTVALEEAAATRDAFVLSATRDRGAFIAAVLAAVPGTLVNVGAQNVPHILNFSFPGRDTDYLAALLDERGFAVATRSACETDSADGSRAVFTLTGDRERSAATLRISWGASTPGRDLKRCAEALVGAVRFIDRARL